MRLRIAAEEPAKYRDDITQVAEIKRSPEWVVGFAEIEHKQAPARFGHSKHFPETRFCIRQIAEAITDRDDIERVVIEGKSFGIAPHEVDRKWIRLAALSSHFQHCFAEIEPDDPGTFCS